MDGDHAPRGDWPLATLPWWRRSRAVFLAAFLLVALVNGGARMADVVAEYRRSEGQALTSRADTAAALAHATRTLVGQYVHVAGNAVELIFRGTLRAQSRRALLNSIRRTYPEIDGIVVLDRAGRVVDADDRTAPLIGRGLSDRAYYQAIAGGAGRVVGDLVLSRASGIATIPIAVAGRAPDGSLLGLVVLGLRASTIGRHLEPRLSGDAFAVLVDRTGRLVFHGAFADLAWEQRDYSGVPPIAEALAGRDASWTGFRSPVTGEPRIGAVVPVPDLGWAVGVLQPVHTALAPARAELGRALVWTGVVLWLSLVLALLLGIALSRPVDALARGVLALSEGRLDHRVEVRSRDEFGWLAEAFNRMAARLEEHAATLEAERGRFEAVLRQMPAGVIVAEAPSGRFILSNAQAAEIVGGAAGTAAGVEARREYQAFRPAGRAYEPDEWPLSRSIRTGEIVTDEEMEIVRSDGARAVTQVSSAPVRDRDGRIVAGVVTFHDVTQARQTEAALRVTEEQLRQSQKMDAVGKLAGGVAHDFNNVLTAITGYSELLLREHDNDQAGKDLEEIRRAADRAAGLTRQLLAFSRQQVLQPRVLQLDAAVREMEKMLRRLIGEDVELVAHLDPALGRVKADPGQIEQVVMNLAVNARDAMPDGGRLTIETANVELDDIYAREHVSVQPGPYVMLAVSDSGCGMTPEVQARIFEPFFTTKEQGKGTGLGLSTVYGIVKQSGGNIWVYSEVGKGTTVKIYFPRVDEPLESTAATRPAARAVRGAETILVVEDEKGVRALVRRVLEEAGYAVLEARDGDEALRISEEHQGPIPLMVTDMVMPGTSGADLAGRLMPRRPEMKVLYMSGYTDRAVLRQAAFEPGTPFLEKPFTPGALASKVRETLDAPARPDARAP